MHSSLYPSYVCQKLIGLPFDFCGMLSVCDVFVTRAYLIILKDLLDFK